MSQQQLHISPPPDRDQQAQELIESIRGLTRAFQTGGATTNGRVFGHIFGPPGGNRPELFNEKPLASDAPISATEQKAIDEKLARAVERGMREGLRRVGGPALGPAFSGGGLGGGGASGIAGASGADGGGHHAHVLATSSASRAHAEALMAQGFTPARAAAMGAHLASRGVPVTGPGSPAAMAQGGSGRIPQAVEMVSGVSSLARLRGPATPEVHPFAMMNAQPRALSDSLLFQNANAAAYQNAAIAGNLGFYGIAGNISRFAGMGRGLSELGYGRAGAALSRAAPLLAAGSAAGGAVQTGADSYWDPYLTNEQIGRKAFRDVVPGGERAQRFFDSVTGRNAKFLMANVDAQKQAQDFHAETRITGYLMRHEVEQTGREERAKQLGGAKAVVMPEIDRSTAAGEHEYRVASRLLPAKREMAKAERDRAAAAKELSASNSELVKIEGRLQELEARRAQLAKDTEGKRGSGPEHQRKLLELQNVENMIRDNRQLSMDARQQRFAASGKLAEAEAGVKMAGAAEMQARSENTRDLAASSSGRAKALGRMNAAERVQAQAYYQLVTENPDMLDVMPTEVLDTAAQFNPAVVDKLFERRGVESEQFKFGQRVAPTEFGPEGSTPESLRRQEIVEANQAAEQQLGAEADIARAASEAGKDMAQPVIAAINAIRDSFKRDVDTTQRIQRNQQ